MIISLLQSFVIILFETACCKIFADTFFHRKEYINKWIKKYILVIMFIGFFVISTILLSFALLKYISIVAFIILLWKIYYHAKLKQILFFAIIYFGILISIDYSLLTLLKFIFSKDYYSFLNSPLKGTLIALLCKTVLFIIFFFIRRIWKPHDSLNMITNKEMIRFAYFPLLTLGTIFALIATTDYENMVQNISLLFIAVGMAIMNMVIFYLIHDIIDREIQIQNDRLVQERTKNQMRLYYTMKESFEKQKKYMHDYKNQLNCIKGLLMNGKLQESIDYITGLTGNIDMDMDSIHTNNVVADAVINQKYRDAKRNGIIIMITVNDLSRLIITEQDLVSLLSNLLDNAIEACQKLEENKVIQFKCMNDKNQLIIAVNNPVREDIQIIDQRIATTKENKQDHGIGLLNIREIINKYNGTSAIKCENHWFYFSALIPNEIL